MGKHKTGIGKLLSAMKKNIREVNDQEVCRRLEILMHSEKEDMNIGLVKKLLESPPYEIDPKDVPEPFSQYVKHYYYMLKREERIKLKEGDVPKLSSTAVRKKISTVTRPPSISKKAVSKKSTAAKKSADEPKDNKKTSSKKTNTRKK